MNAVTDFILERFADVPVIDLHRHGREGFLQWCAEHADAGTVAEFGVWNGYSLSILSHLFSDRQVHGFDSFVGLPETWSLTSTNKRAAGHFTRDGSLPKVAKNVVLHSGFFSASIPRWKEHHRDTFALIHIDSDLYSSAMDVLTGLNDMIVPGTIIVFDELADWKQGGAYSLWADGEAMALFHWSERYSRTFEPLCRSEAFQAAIKVIE